MNSNKTGLFLLSLLGLCGEHAQAQTNAAQDVIAIKAAENSLVGYNQRNHFQKKLLEFVSPVYKDPLIKDALVAKVLESKSATDSLARDSANRILDASSTSIHSESQGRLAEQAFRLQAMSSMGMKAPGEKAITRAAGLSAKQLELRERIAFLKDNLVYTKESNEIRRQMRKEAIDNLVANVQQSEIDVSHSVSGRHQNVLLDDMKELLLRYGPSVDADPVIAGLLNTLTFSKDDLAHIRLELEERGRKIIFAANEGSGSLGQIPFAMRHPSLLPYIRDYEERLAVLAKDTVDEQEFYEKVLSLSDLVDRIDAAAIEVLGTSRVNAKKGPVEYEAWNRAADYRLVMRGLVDRLKLEGNSAVLKRRGKYDPNVQGFGILPFASFVATEGCRFSAAKPGDEQTYVKLQYYLRKLQVLLKARE